MKALSLREPPEVHSIGSFKRYAKQLKRESGIPLSQAQEALAKALGYRDFHAARNALSAGSPSRTEEPTDDR